MIILHCTRRIGPSWWNLYGKVCIRQLNTLYSVHLTLYIEPFALHISPYKLYTVYLILHTDHCTVLLYTAHLTLHTATLLHQSLQKAAVKDRVINDYWAGIRNASAFFTLMKASSLFCFVLTSYWKLAGFACSFAQYQIPSFRDNIVLLKRRGSFKRNVEIWDSRFFFLL